MPWWQHFGTGRLCVVVLRDGVNVLAIAPFFSSDENSRTLRFIGAGNTDYLDLLVDDRAPDDCAAVILQHFGRLNSCDTIELTNLRHDSPLVKPNACTEFHEYVEKQDACPVLSLPHSADEFIEELPRQLRYNLGYYRRKLVLLGEMTFDHAVANNFEELFAALVTLHEARWRMLNSPGVLFADSVQNFHREASRRLLSHNALRLYALRCGGRIIACFYGFHYARRTYYYLGGFDPQFAQYGPGTILIAHAIHEAIREEATSFDFLCGRESYKYRWGAVDQVIYRKSFVRKAAA